MGQILAEELVLSGSYWCVVGYNQFLNSVTWILGAVWEVLALCLAVWIAVKHFRELQQLPRGWTVRNTFEVLIQTHVLYFAS